MRDFIISSMSEEILLQDDMLVAVVSCSDIAAKDRRVRSPDDFNNKGVIVITRRPRGRPARITDEGMVRYAE